MNLKLNWKTNLMNNQWEEGQQGQDAVPESACLTLKSSLQRSCCSNYQSNLVESKVLQQRAALYLYEISLCLRMNHDLSPHSIAISIENKLRVERGDDFY